MIKLNIACLNPFYKNKDVQVKNYYSLCKSFTKTHKFIEIEFMSHDSYHLFLFLLNTCWWGHDHAGFEISLTLYKLTFSFNLYDRRHWDYENNCWCED
jgi:hypothetical protein